MTSGIQEAIRKIDRMAIQATGWQSRLGVLGTLLAAGIMLPLLTGTRAAAQEAAPSYNVLYTFTGGADGYLPSALIRDAAGNLYGTSNAGGNYGAGVVFKLDPKGKLKVLYTFTGGSDGGYPPGGVVRDAAGNLYGTVSSGGEYGAGGVFKLDPQGKETVVYSFTGGKDGSNPLAGIIRDTAGNLYGTTGYGGKNSGFGSCCGVAFEVDASGKETVLHTFTGPPDGAYLQSGVLLRDGSGNLYGITVEGGNTGKPCPSVGCGVVFKLDSVGKETVLHRFTGTDGSDSWSNLIRDSAGNLYGTTTSGGKYGWGVVFSLDPQRKESVLYAFSGGNDGTSPGAGVIRDSAGNLYGTTVWGGNEKSSSCPYGSQGCGVVFQLNPQGKEHVLYAFTGGTDGGNPGSDLIQDKAGNLYGTTAYGGNTNSSCPNGNYGCGVIFKLTP